MEGPNGTPNDSVALTERDMDNDDPTNFVSSQKMVLKATRSLFIAGVDFTSG